MLCRCKRPEGQAREGSILALQEALETGQLLRYEREQGSVSKKLEESETRLRRVHRWGGAYGLVDFSPTVKALLGAAVPAARSGVPAL